MRGEFAPQSPEFWQKHFEESQTFVGDPYQRGGSVGSFLRGLLRFVLPVVKSAGTAVAKEALKTGAAIATDIAEGKDIKETAVRRVKEGTEHLAEEAIEAASAEVKRRKTQQGRGLGKRPAKKTIYIEEPPRKIIRRKKKTKADIFGFY